MVKSHHVRVLAGIIIVVLLLTTIYFSYLGTLDFFAGKPSTVQDFGIAVVSVMLLIVAVKVRDRL